MFCVYVIRSLKRTYNYVGLTSDLEKRIERHQKGYEKTTRPYRPFKLILVEYFPTRLEARKREKYLKSGVGKEFIKAMM
ncbi:MAG: GIY-YIG nuclease family protein [Cyclobacteriaceae bacterium]|nr:GIY-YIG nuclease family protein [Cyclobacteriaceae bacterium]